jgi:hypothetical protein
MPELLKLMDDWAGFRDVRTDEMDEAKMAQLVDLIGNAGRMPIHRWEYFLKEAITTSDFPYLFGQTLDIQLLAMYQLAIPDWRAYVDVGSCKDFNARRIEKVTGNEDLLDEVAEKGEYLVAPMHEGRYSIAVKKRGRQFDISWEATVNDFLQAFTKMPARFASAATYTEALLATALFASAAGPNVSLYGAPIADPAGGNVTNVGVLPLTIQNVEATLALMAQQQNQDGQPLGIRGIHLVVPPALEFTGRAIITSALKQWTEVGAGAGIPVPTTNVLPQLGLQLHVNPLLPVIDTSGNVDTTWYLFASLDQGSACELDYLLGNETPEICMKASDKVSVTGAPLSPFSGDFATDNIFYRVRIVCGGTQLDPRMTYSQVG